MSQTTNPNTINHERLKLASNYAKTMSGCTKVSVGSIIFKNGHYLFSGANQTDLNLCKAKGCLRIEKYGMNTKEHRNPDDCRAIHSEIDAITMAARCGVSLKGATIYVTRYPCEACARAIVNTGITHVVYGREQPISEQTARLFEYHDIEVDHIKDYKEEDVLT